MNLFEYNYNIVRQIPSGRVSTYGAVAEALGDKRAARAVGRMMNQNPDADSMPCFKIVYRDGTLGGFGLGIHDKIRRLTKDGITITDGKIDDFPHVFFQNFKTNYPLHQLQAQQKQLSSSVLVHDDFSEPIETIGGVDVAYPKNEFEEACAAYVAVDNKTQKIVERHLAYEPSLFPYIPGYLAYRETPVIDAVLKKIRNKPTILMVDGNGILHPRRCGIASFIGVNYSVPTIGVAKSKLLGEEKQDTVYINDEPRARCLKAGRATKPIYISPGHKISLETSYQITKKLCLFKQPEPLRWAHTLAIQGLRECR
ncbi:MAG: endonuclease V [Candidatus Thermoplasmatota archaeon]|nr:endonuclease V [Candidatus Thermoplasmatota archaeon]